MMFSLLSFQAGRLGDIFALPRPEASGLPEVFRLIFIAATMALYAAFILIDSFLNMLFPDLGP